MNGCQSTCVSNLSKMPLASAIGILTLTFADSEFPICVKISSPKYLVAPPLMLTKLSGLLSLPTVQICIAISAQGDSVDYQR